MTQRPRPPASWSAPAPEAMGDVPRNESVLFSESWQNFGYSALLPDPVDDTPALHRTSDAGTPIHAARPHVPPADAACPTPAAVPFPAKLAPAPLARVREPSAPVASSQFEEPAFLDRAGVPTRRRSLSSGLLIAYVMGIVVAVALAFAHPASALIVLFSGLSMTRDRTGSSTSRIVGIALTLLGGLGMAYQIAL